MTSVRYDEVQQELSLSLRKSVKDFCYHLRYFGVAIAVSYKRLKRNS